MELYFEILRKKQHLLVQARENWTAKDLKRVVEGILKVPPEKQTLCKPTNEQRTEWEAIDEKQTLHELGFTMKNARADGPAVLALVLPEDGKSPDIVPMTIAPPVPEAMAQNKQSEVEMVEE
ncbi:hypothetical protein niasHT_007718 [Heterodera trifolii]|uniref:Uncharacterized protein n=1 Tax=Heterodera trifolii TaxID=157864 RepID=A0ABD2MCM2_9BILA